VLHSINPGTAFFSLLEPAHGTRPVSGELSLMFRSAQGRCLSNHPPSQAKEQEGEAKHSK
jgi:hypothetical protein